MLLNSRSLCLTLKSRCLYSPSVKVEFEYTEKIYFPSGVCSITARVTIPNKKKSFSAFSDIGLLSIFNVVNPTPPIS